MAEPDRPHVLYRMYDSSQRLLYVGLTLDVSQRFAAHRNAKPWWLSVSTIRLQHFPSRAAVMAAERHAIRDEKPRHNIVHRARLLVGSSQSADVAEEETHTPHRNVRVDDDLWKPFGRGFGERNRSSWIKDVIGWLVADPQLWHDAKAIASKRGEALGAVVVKAVRSYVRRNRSLIDED